MAVYIADKTNVVLHLGIFQLNHTIQNTILREASEQLGRPVTWDDIEDYNITLKVELSLFETGVD